MSSKKRKRQRRRKNQSNSSAVSTQNSEQNSVAPKVTLSISEFHHLIETKNTIVPSAEELQRLNEVVENGAERLFTLVEKQQDHRHSLEAMTVTSDIKTRSQGQLIGTLLALVIILGGFVLIYLGHDKAGASVIIGTVGTVLTAYIINRTNILIELAEKRRRMLGLPTGDKN